MAPEPFSPPRGHREFTVAEALAAGIRPGRLRGRDLARPFHGVRIVGDTNPDLAARCRALQRRLSPLAWFSGPTAALVIGIPLPRRLESSTEVHVSVPAPRRAPTGRGVIGHSSTIDPAAIRVWNGLRISGTDRTWCELAPLLDLGDLVAAGDFLVHHRLPLTDIDQLAAAVQASGLRRGLALATRAIPLLSTRSESRRESILRVILVTAGVPGLAVNVPITTTDGYAYRGDLAFPHAKVVVEYQSDYHREPEQFRRDMTRKSRLQADGWLVVEVNADDLADPVELVARIRRVLSARTIGARA